MVKLRYIGHAAVLLESADVTMIIDPFLTGNPKATIKPEDIQKLDYILVTHGHGDHIGDAVSLAKQTGATLVANYELCHYFAAQEAKVHPMHIGGRTQFSFGTLKMTPALHGSGIQTPDGLIEGGSAGGFVIETDNQRIYHAGDTGLTMDMMLLANEKIDIAFLPIGGNFTMDITDALRAVEFIKPKVMVPIHYNTFPLIQADPGLLKDYVAKSQLLDYSGKAVSVNILEPGEDMTTHA